ncbi:hypothetical protein COO60DRAFT_1552601 [Scenedesmus sp. NREL 46B-D3]|nr:hypothetical protein COO60DRAFT_1552601 [Scenedesmus sp. NREL 46B-D3]
MCGTHAVQRLSAALVNQVSMVQCRTPCQLGAVPNPSTWQGHATRQQCQHYSQLCKPNNSNFAGSAEHAHTACSLSVRDTQKADMLLQTKPRARLAYGICSHNTEQAAHFALCCWLHCNKRPSTNRTAPQQPRKTDCVLRSCRPLQSTPKAIAAAGARLQLLLQRHRYEAA